MRPASIRHAIILPVVLVLIGLLSLIMAGFIFFIRAEGEGIMAYADGHQARLAAESGFQEVVALLRDERDNVAAWYDVPTLHHALVWAEDYERDGDPVRELGSRKDLLEREGRPTPAWRFSVPAARFDGPEDMIRFGLTPESAKLHLNAAEEWQIERLLPPLLVGLQIDNPQDIINAILDWRDEDSEVRDGGAESDYYNALDPGPPYNAKNGPFDSVEELLLVKGVTAAVLYGEDVNRNGILDENEDDGEVSFPYYDNADGILDYGIAPFLTVWSREVDASLDNKQRISLYNNGATIQALLETYVSRDELDELGQEDEVETLSEQTIAFILGIAGNQQVIGQMRSPADLYVGGEELDPNGAGEVPAELAASPVLLEEMPFIMDRFSTRPPQEAGQPILGLININAAPVRVLMTVPNMTQEAAEAIVAGRQEFDADTLRTTAWPLTTETLDAATFKAIAPYITTKAHQFHVEIVGYADHVKTARRFEWIIEMVGPLAQVKYHRELTRLGVAWPLDDETVIVRY
jgi:DNA uptake protein ComE-like DNA-binding protein